MIMDKKRETQKKMKIDFKNSFFYLHAFLLEDFLSVSCHRIAEQLLYIHIDRQINLCCCCREKIKETPLIYDVVVVVADRML